MDKAQVGKRGEQVAAKYLKRHGYEILERNIHISHQEIDIIAINRECIAFVEVKTRLLEPGRADRYTTPSAAVTPEKRRFLLKAAFSYMGEHGYKLQPRMDVIEVYLTPDQIVPPLSRLWEKVTGIFGTPKRQVLRINHIENAFGLNGYIP